MSRLKMGDRLCFLLVIMIVRDFQQVKQCSSNCCVRREVNDIKHSYAFLTDMVERMSIPVFSDIHTALECARRVLKNVSCLTYIVISV
jgi:hypothetical protein